MKLYNTEQKRALLDFLKKHSNEQFTIEEIACALSGCDSAPGKSTVYRLMTRLVDSGDVRRFAPENSRHFYYQYVDAQKCARHLHLKCVCCGKLIHVDDEVTALMQDKLLSRNNFIIDEGHNIIYGKCADCK